jgi:hypothetical protein
MTLILDETAVKALIETCVPNRLVPWGSKFALLNAFDWASSPQGSEYWRDKRNRVKRWAKKDTKFLEQLIGFVEEDDIWL